MPLDRCGQGTSFTFVGKAEIHPPTMKSSPFSTPARGTWGMFPLQIPVRINHPMSHSKNIWSVSPTHHCPPPPSTSLMQTLALAFWPAGCAIDWWEPPAERARWQCSHSRETCKFGGARLHPCPSETRADFKLLLRISWTSAELAPLAWLWGPHLFSRSAPQCGMGRVLG
jgi:hypothetical protein